MDRPTGNMNIFKFFFFVLFLLVFVVFLFDLCHEDFPIDFDQDIWLIHLSHLLSSARCHPVEEKKYKQRLESRMTFVKCKSTDVLDKTPDDWQ